MQPGTEEDIEQIRHQISNEVVIRYQTINSSPIRYQITNGPLIIYNSGWSRREKGLVNDFLGCLKVG